ncbi:MAG: tetratricopeptide repeat protein [Proteobacteria bacterium]|nr:tetratricopeptide repeat protein [Pseudomonadota bacterium]
MGLFSFFTKSVQKTEALGDTYFSANKFGSAKLEYESALDIIEKRHPDDQAMKARVLEKLKNSKESLARQHLESGDQLFEANALEDAKKLFSIALSLTEDPELQQTLRQKIASKIAEIPEDEPDEFLVPEPDDEPEPEPYDTENAFEVLCMTLPEEMGQAYRSYGETFKQGFLALSQGDFTLAAEKLRQAMDENPSGGSYISVELATALINLGQSQGAIEQLTLYLQNNPSSFHGISMLCDIFCELKRFDEALTVLEQSPENINESPEGIRLKGRIYYLEGDYQKAEEIFRGVLDDFGWDLDLARELAMTLGASDKTKEAMTLYADLLNQCTGCGQRPSPLDKKAFADLSFKLNDFSDSILNLYLDLANDHAEIRSECFFKASAIYKNTGNEKEAARFLKLAETLI